jgi:hypothetical protein
VARLSAFELEDGLVKDREGWLSILNGNEAALRFCECLSRISNTWDDLIDLDRLPPAGEINAMLWMALAELPVNPFYQEHFSQLYPLIVNGMLAYLTSVHYERTVDPHGLELAHGLRYLITNAITQVVYICGGAEHALRVLPQVYKRICRERLADYLGEFAQANPKDISKEGNPIGPDNNPL